MYALSPEGAKHLHDLPSEENADKEDTDMESFNANGTDNVAVEGGIFDAPEEVSAGNGNVEPSVGLEPAAPFDDGGRNARRHANTGRPPHIWPEVWQAQSWKKRKKATADWAAECKLKGTDWWGKPLPSGTAAVAGTVHGSLAQSPSDSIAGSMTGPSDLNMGSMINTAVNTTLG